MGRIICTGNRLVEADSFGPRVHDYLEDSALPSGVELFDGGLAGLDLLPLLECDGPVVLVDSLEADAGPGEVVVLDAIEAAREMEPGYGHDGGLAYLLRVLPEVSEGSPPRIHLVAAAGIAAGPTVAQAAQIALSLARIQTGRTTGTRAPLETRGHSSWKTTG